MPQPNPCALCAQWTAADRQAAYQAFCAVVGRKTAFNDTCPAWQPVSVAPAPVRPPESYGDYIAGYGYLVPGKKP